MVATTPSQRSASWVRRAELPLVLPGFVLAAIMLWSVARSLIEANWVEGLDLIMALVLPALVIGALFARISWMPGWLANLLASALGIAWTIQQVTPFLLARVSEEYGTELASRLDTWGERAIEIMLRVAIWFRIIQAGGRGEDIVLFVVVIATIMWLLGYFTGWLIFREQRTWLAVVLSAAIILINYTFTWPKPNLLFFIFLGTALLLMVYQNVAQQQRLWRAAKIEFPGALLWRAVLAAGAFCAALVILTSVLPGTVTSGEAQRAWRVLRSPFASIRESWQDAFSTINAPPGTSGSFATRGVRVGGPRSLGNALVMRVRSPRSEYWRAVAFDRYTGRNWQNTVGERARAVLGVATAEQARSYVPANEPLIQAELRSRELITQTVTLAQGRTDGLIMVTGQLAWAAVPLQVQSGILSNTSGETLPNYTEISSAVADISLEAGTFYTITTYLSTVDQRSLREAGTNYPDWVREAYLQLPDTLPIRVRERAQEIVDAAGATTAYDQAVALQNALRVLAYDERRAAPPEDRDWVDYFLFDSQRGYCDDFASAMVVMLRSLDVPTRWVQGYAGGELDTDTSEWVISESVAHSWVEVYFPGYGWQRFEPTPATYASVPVRPAVPVNEEEEKPERSGDISNQLSDPEEILRRIREREEQLNGEGSGDLSTLAAEIAKRDAERRRDLILSVSAVVGVLVAGALGSLLYFQWQLRGLSPTSATYARLIRFANWAGIPFEEQYTPREYASVVGQHLPGMQQPVQQIAAAFEAERYRPAHRADDDIRPLWPAVRAALIRWRFTRGRQ
jgi:transglutaminase-like putative cysteine protease